MQIYNNEIVIHRGEAFTISKRILNRNGSPYIVSNQLAHPYWVVSVASARYAQADRYVYNAWLSLDDSAYNLPRFKYTRPVRLKDISGDNATFANTTIPAGFEGNRADYADIAVFYDKNSAGVTEYKYWKYTNSGVRDDGDTTGEWIEYLCPITMPFSTEITNKWVERNYYYSILLVDGVLAESINAERPLKTISHKFEILKPTTLRVDSNINEVTLI